MPSSRAMARRLSPEAPSVARCRRAASRISRVISARVRSRAARSTDGRSRSVWLMITSCRSAIISNFCEQCS